MSHPSASGSCSLARAMGLGLVLVFATSLPFSATAQGVWRCGADGRTYSDSPCPGGRALDLGPGRSAGDAEAARADVQRQLAWAQASRAERERTEMRLLAASAVPANLGPSSQKVTPSQPRKIKPRAEPRPQPAKPKFHRSAGTEPGPADGGTWPIAVQGSRHRPG